MLLTVRNLKVSLPGHNGMSEILQGSDFSIEKGDVFGFVGESGSGKSMTALSLLHLLPSGAEVTAEQLEFAGMDLRKRNEKDWCAIRGKEIAIVFQEPMTSLNPVLTIEKQVEEVLLLHEKEIYRRSKEERRKKVLDILTEAELKNPEKLLHAYPHQLSGGMRQRVMLAIAMLLRPKLLIVDEPTTALDAHTQKRIMSLLDYYRKEYQTTILFISHDLSLIRSFCNKIAVMKDGRIVEQGETEEIFNQPKENYTKALVHTNRGKKLREDLIIENNPILTVSHVDVTYTDKRIFGKSTKTEVLKDISFELKKGEILGLVGNSGSGKSTLSKAITGLVPITKGEIRFALGYERPQMVFQDPYGSLNPARRIAWILNEPLQIAGGMTREERKERVIAALKEVELNETYLKRYIRELSGGQRQRVAIACALICHPEIVILDEPVSALDMTVQNQILKLLCKLQKERGTSFLMISHDMTVVERVCDRVLKLKDGSLQEMA